MAVQKIRTRQRGKAGSWYYSFEIARVEGKRKSIEKGGFSSENDAYSAGIKAWNEYHASGSVFQDTKISVADFFDSWLRDVAPSKVRPNTLANYKKMIKCHIKPALGGYLLAKLTPTAIDKWIIEEHISHHLAYSTLDNMLKVCKVALDYAVYPAGLLKDNPARLIRTPREAPRQPKLRCPLTQDETIQIMEYFKGTNYYIPVLIGYYTGFRIGEVLGLTWQDIDFDKSTITISHQLQRITGNGRSGYGGKGTGCWYIAPTKTVKSQRCIKVGSTLMEALKSHKTAQVANELRYGMEYQYVMWRDEWNEDTKRNVKRIRTYAKGDKVKAGERLELVCTQECGDFIRATSFQAACRGMRLRLGIEQFDFHTLRHTHAQLLIEGGAHIKDVCARLGHSSIETTVDIYTDDSEAMQQGTVDLFEKLSAPTQRKIQ